MTSVSRPGGARRRRRRAARGRAATSFDRMRLMWVLTVASLRNSPFAISELLRPRAASRNTSRSRAVSVAERLRRLDRRGARVEVPEQLARRRRGDDGGAGVHGADRRRAGTPGRSPSAGTRSRRRGSPGSPPRRGRRWSARSPAGSRSTAPPASATMRSVASMPSMTGIRMSISTTSGRASRDELDAVAAVARLAHEREVGLGVHQHPDAGAEQRLVVDQRDADRRAHASASVGAALVGGRSGAPAARRARRSGPPRARRSGARRRAARARSCRRCRGRWMPRPS